MSFDLVWLDALAALAVAFFVAKIALSLCGAYTGTIDTALPLEQVDAIRAVALSVPGSRDVHQIRTRSNGRKDTDVIFASAGRPPCVCV